MLPRTYSLEAHFMELIGNRISIWIPSFPCHWTGVLGLITGGNSDGGAWLPVIATIVSDAKHGFCYGSHKMRESTASVANAKILSREINPGISRKGLGGKRTILPVVTGTISSSISKYN